MSDIDPYAAPACIDDAEVAPVPSVRVDDPTALGVWAIVLLVAGTALDAFHHVRLTLAGSAGDASSDRASVVSGIIYLANVVVFLCWSYRVLSNTRRIDPSVQTVSPGWGVGSYFVPVVQLWLPARALYQASKVSGTGGGLVIGWWVAALAMVGLAFLYFGGLLAAPVGWEDEVDPGRMTPMDHLILLADIGVMALEVILIRGFNRVQGAWARAGFNRA